jgi:hypothetical protein
MVVLFKQSASEYEMVLLLLLVVEGRTNDVVIDLLKPLGQQESVALHPKAF